MTPTTARLDFLRHAGWDLSPNPSNIRHLIESGWTTAGVAETYGVSTRTIQRYLSDPARCPNGCMTMTPGGRVCHWCQREPER